MGIIVAAAWTTIGPMGASATKGSIAERTGEFEVGAGAYTVDAIVALDFRLKPGELLGRDVDAHSR